MRQFRTLIVAISAMMLASVVVACGEDPTPTPTPTPAPQAVKIGLLSPVTGPIAQYAPGFEDAGKVAINELNKTHAGDYVFELIIGDSACDGTAAATAAQTLIDSGVSAIAGAACSGATLGIA